MNKLKKEFISILIRNPKLGLGIIWFAKASRFINLMPDKLFLETNYYFTHGKELNLKNPQTYSEKLQWLKLYDRNPMYTQMVDKFRVKEYVSKILGDNHIFPLIKVYEKAEDIKFEELPNQFVLKCNNDSGSLVICRDKAKGIMFRGKSDDKKLLTQNEVRELLDYGLKNNWFWKSREWAYKEVKPCIIAEKYMESKTNERKDLFDYKFWCFDGEPRYIWLGTNYIPSFFDIYSSDWVNQHVEYGYDNAPNDSPRPKNLDKMIEIARKLAKGIPHVRVDLYDIDGKIYFGEYTFYTWSGFTKFNPIEFDRIMGDNLHLPSH